VKIRIEAIRRIFHRCWFNEAITEAVRLAPGSYYERKDDARKAGLGPNKDWSCHGADAFGLMAIAYEEPSRSRGLPPEDRVSKTWTAVSEVALQEFTVRALEAQPIRKPLHFKPASNT
jgi:hypothetical protein